MLGKANQKFLWNANKKLYFMDEAVANGNSWIYKNSFFCNAPGMVANCYKSGRNLNRKELSVFIKLNFKLILLLFSCIRSYIGKHRSWIFHRVSLTTLLMGTLSSFFYITRNFILFTLMVINYWWMDGKIVSMKQKTSTSSLNRVRSLSMEILLEIN